MKRLHKGELIVRSVSRWDQIREVRYSGFGMGHDARYGFRYQGYSSFIEAEDCR